MTLLCVKLKFIASFLPYFHFKTFDYIQYFFALNSRVNLDWGLMTSDGRIISALLNHWWGFTDKNFHHLVVWIYNIIYVVCQ